MKFWLVLLAVSLVVMAFGWFLHKIEERSLGVELKIDDMASYGSVIFLFGMIATVFSGMMVILCV